MSKTKDALYDYDNGRYVDAMKEEERAEYLWKHHPQSPRFRPPTNNTMTNVFPQDQGWYELGFKKRHTEKIPERVLTELRQYVEEGIEPSHFIGAVLSNDLNEAVRSIAPDEDKKALEHITIYCFVMLPGNCRGSRERYLEHIARKRTEAQPQGDE